MVLIRIIFFCPVVTLFVILRSTSCEQSTPKVASGADINIDEETKINQVLRDAGRNLSSGWDAQLLDSVTVGTLSTNFAEKNMLINIVVNDLIIEKLSVYEVKGIQKRYDENTMSVRFNFPYVKIRGKYKTHGELAPYSSFVGMGEMKIAVHQMVTEAICQIRDGEKRTLSLIGPNFDTTYGAIAAQFSNLLGNDELNSNIQKFSIFLARQVFAALQPTIDRKLTQHFELYSHIHYYWD